MLRRALIAATLLALALPPGADAARRDCWPKGTKTIERSEHARVYSAGDRTYACLYSAGRRVQIGGPQPDDFFQYTYAPHRLAGRYLAHLTLYQPPEAHESDDLYVQVVDLRTGKVRRAARAWVGDDEPPSDPEDYPEPRLTGLALTTGGYAAWISNWVGDREVWRYDSRGARRLDRGRRLGGLRLTKGRVHWQRDGSPKVASFR